MTLRVSMAIGAVLLCAAFSMIAAAESLPEGNPEIAKLTDCTSAKTCYADGYHLFKAGEKQQAAREWQTACAFGDASSCEWAGLAYGQTDNAVSARPLNKIACERYEIKSSCFYYGWDLVDGHGGETDPVRGRLLLEPICETGAKHQAAACQTLGKVHYAGLGVPKDWIKARDLMVTSCDLGNRTGCFNLGIVSSNPVNSYTYSPDAAQSAYGKACNLGLSAACERLNG